MANGYPYPDPFRLEQQVLLRLGRKHQVPSARAARGACFSAVLDLALEAQTRGIEVVLLNWRVRGDRHFVDHWAIRYGDSVALDLTSAQFDPKAPLLCPLAGYPELFDRLREYPAHLFLDRYLASINAKSRRLNPAFLWHAGVQMWRHDMPRALKNMGPAAFIQANLRLARLATVLGIQQLESLTFRRLAALRGRLR